MKKTILSTLLIASLLLLTGCLPVIQGAFSVNTVVSVSSDRRTAGAVLDDNTIAFKLFTWSTASSDPVLDDAHLNFMVYDKSVLITGEAPNDSIRRQITKQTKLQDAKIAHISNELIIGANSSLLSRSKDSAITLQIELLFYDQEVFNPKHIRVMTENQTVYLMGAVTKREADKAVKVASKAKWVKKVIKLFHYLAARPAAEIERDRQIEMTAQKQAALEKQQAVLNAKKAALRKQINALGDGSEGTVFN
ncbi:BON domain-containing protein [Candidatus Thioglobus sp.]|uniref:BON domain-containing protein n=1 Tax=Candidatus Thioglobus sp. TaxID=2026721 RepID=UPI003D0ACC48